jgi:hypothetical protein
MILVPLFDLKFLCEFAVDDVGLQIGGTSRARPVGAPERQICKKTGRKVGGRG